MKRINVRERLRTAGSDFGATGISYGEGALLAGIVAHELEQNDQVLLDFEGVTCVSSAFCNAFLRDLWEEFNNRISSVGLDASAAQVLTRCAKNTREYWTIPAVKDAVDKIAAELFDER